MPQHCLKFFFKRSSCEVTCRVKNKFHPMLILVFEVIVQLLTHAIRNCTIFRFFSPMCATSSAFLLSTYALSVPHLGHLCLHTAQCGLKSENCSKKVDFSTVFPFLTYVLCKCYSTTSANSTGNDR